MILPGTSDDTITSSTSNVPCASDSWLFKLHPAKIAGNIAMNNNSRLFIYIVLKRSSTNC